MARQAQYTHEPVGVYGKGVIGLYIQFAPAGSSTPTALKGAYTSSVARTSAGLWTVTFETHFTPTAFLGGYVSVFDNANPGIRNGQYGLYAQTLPAAGTLQIYNSDYATPTLQDVAANANSIVRAMAFFKMNPAEDAMGLGGL